MNSPSFEDFFNRLCQTADIEQIVNYEPAPAHQEWGPKKLASPFFDPGLQIHMHTPTQKNSPAQSNMIFVLQILSIRANLHVFFKQAFKNAQLKMVPNQTGSQGRWK